MNTRSARAKTYHLLVSFRPEDEAKLTPELLKEMETAFAQGLGLTEHQRHVAVHKNTNNLHLHIAFNLIHPETFFHQAPFRDFRALSRVCRELEKSYGLAVDRGMEDRPPKEQTQPRPRIKTMEIQSGQESFFTHVQKRREDILTALEKAENWPKVHNIFGGFGLCLKPRGNGLAVTDSQGRFGLKASDLDRSLSKAKMETRFGLFQAPERIDPAEESATAYTAEPLHQGPERDKLYTQFQAEIGQRRSTLADIEQAYQIRLAEHRRHWQGQAEELRRRPMLRKAKNILWAEWRRLEKEALARIRRETTAKRKEIRQTRPYRTWVDFLKFLAGQGQESALAVLRSVNTAASQSTPETQTPAQTRPVLAAVKQMRAVFRHPDSPFRGYREFQEPRYTIDARGTIIFTLPGGGTIRDSGTAIRFSIGEEKAKIMAGLLAQTRWGPAVELPSNSLKPSLITEPSLTNDPPEQTVTPPRAGGFSR